MEVKKLSWRVITAGVVALVADILQWVLLPLGTPLGLFDPDGVDQILDITVAGIMVSLLGFHWVFIPSALGKMTPMVDMMPFWTGAVFIVALGKEGMVPAMANAPGQNALPLNSASPAPAALPMGASPVPAPTDAQTAKALKPFFRETEH